MVHGFFLKYVHLLLTIWRCAPGFFFFDWIIIYHFTGFFLFLDFCFLNKKSCLKNMKNFDLSIENALFLKWNFVFSILIYIQYIESCANFHSVYLGMGVVKYTLYYRFDKVQWYYARLNILIKLQLKQCI